MSVGEVVQAVEEFGMKHVLVTGGEPLLQPRSLELMERLSTEQRIVLVEDEWLNGYIRVARNRDRHHGY